MLGVQTNEEFKPTIFPQFLYDSIALSAHIEVSVWGTPLFCQQWVRSVLFHGK
jgi:hypothetical protein